MKVIFSKSFLSDIFQLGNTINITKHILGNYYEKVTSINLLFKEDYINRDLNKLELSTIQSYWKNDSKELKLFIEIPEEFRESYVESKFNLVYVYYSLLGGVDEIAFVLAGDFEKPLIGDLFKINELNLSMFRNLITIPINNLNCNLITYTDLDTTFLESKGVMPGVSIYDIDSKNLSVSRGSYFNYLKDKTTFKIDDRIFPYLSNTGEEIINNHTYREYSNLILTTNSINFDPSLPIPTDDSLKEQGGSIQLTGSCDFVEYRIVNNVIEKIKEGTIDLLNLDNVFIEDLGAGILDEKLIYDISPITNIVTYSKNDNPLFRRSVIFKASICFLDLQTNTYVTLESRNLELQQGKGDDSIYWEISSDTPYFEIAEGYSYKVYLLAGMQGSTKKFKILTNLLFEESDVIVKSNSVINEYFNIQYSKISDAELEVSIEAKLENNSTNYYPPPSEENILYPFIIQIHDRSETFYCFQEKILGNLSLYKDKSYLEWEEVIDSLEIPYNTSSEKVSLVKKLDLGEPNFWKLIRNTREDLIEVTPTSGFLNEGHPSTWEFNVFDIKPLVSNFNKESVILEFGRVDSEFTMTPFEQIIDWRVAVNIGKLQIKVIMEPEPNFVDTNVKNININSIGSYEFFVKSNCNVEIKSTTNNIKFFNKDSWISVSDSTMYDSIELDTYNKHSGIKVRFAVLSVTGREERDIGKIIIEDVDSTTYSEILISQTYIVPIIKKISPSGIYYFPTSINSSNSNQIKIDSNIDTDIISPINTSKSLIFTNQEYECTNITTEKGVSRVYPSEKLGDLIVNTVGAGVKDDVTYNVYESVISPELRRLDGVGSIYLERVSGSYIDVSISSVYKLTNDNYELTVETYGSSSFRATLDLISESFSGFRYNLRVQALISNDFQQPWNRGVIKIKTFVPRTKLIQGNSNPGISQDDVDEIIGTSELGMSVIQNGTSPDSIFIIDNNIGNISPKGELRNYGIYTNSPITSIDVNVLNSSCDIQYNTYSKSITAEYFDILPKPLFSSGPINVVDGLEENYLKYSRSKTVGFTAKISTQNGKIENLTKETIQSGYSKGLVFRNDTIDNVLFLGEDVSVNKLSFNLVDASATEILFSIGSYDIQNKIIDGQSGIKPTNIYSTDSDSGAYRYEYGNSQFNGPNNVKISFPKNSNPNGILRIFYIEANNSDIRTVLKLEMMHGGSLYDVTSTVDTDNIISFHSSGWSNQLGHNESNGLGIIDKKLITNIPITNLDIVAIPNNNFEFELIPTLVENEYELIGQMNPNYTDKVISGDLSIVYTSGTTSPTVIWTKPFKQGYMNIKLVDKDGIVIDSGNSAGSFIDPYLGGAENSGITESTRLYFKVLSNHVELIKMNNIFSEIEIPITKENIKMSNLPEYSSIWVDNINNSASIYLENGYASKYIISDSQIDPENCPFIENQYIVRPAYVNNEIIFKILNNLQVNYENEETYFGHLIYPFTFFIKKQKL